MNEVDVFIAQLDRNGSKFTELTPVEVETYKLEWFNSFIPAEKQEDAMNCYCFDRGGYCGYLWHVFSYNILNCHEKDMARKAFDGFDKQEAVILENIDDVAYRITDVSSIKAQDLDMLEDIILTAKDFSWAYVKTHELDCGPYFYTAELI